ncbi:hypothetical protein C5E46_34445 [Nocardia nova]|nr:hypothetical protein C5E46_34445 [Nocardia nova]
MHVHGYHSLSPGPILAALAAIVGVPALIVIALVVTHAHVPRTDDNAPTTQATTARLVAPEPAPTEAPAPPCYPFQMSC